VTAETEGTNVTEPQIARVPLTDAQVTTTLASQAGAESLLQLDIRTADRRVVFSVALIRGIALAVELRGADASREASAWAAPAAAVWPALRAELPAIATPERPREPASATIAASRALIAAAQSGRGEVIGATREQLGVPTESAAVFAAIGAETGAGVSIEARLYDGIAERLVWAASWLGSDGTGWWRVRLDPAGLRGGETTPDPVTFAETAEVRLAPTSQTMLEADLLGAIAGDVRRRVASAETAAAPTPRGAELLAAIAKHLDASGAR